MRSLMSIGLAFSLKGTILDSEKLLIHQIVAPIDAVDATLHDLQAILLIARRFDAHVTLLDCYVQPACFDFAVGDSALESILLYRRNIRARLYDLTKEARKLYPQCDCCFVDGSSFIHIVRQSRNLSADLIAVPMPIGVINGCWGRRDLLDELIRSADCPVLCMSGSERQPLSNPSVGGKGLLAV